MLLSVRAGPAVCAVQRLAPRLPGRAASVWPRHEVHRGEHRAGAPEHKHAVAASASTTAGNSFAEPSSAADPEPGTGFKAFVKVVLGTLLAAVAIAALWVYGQAPTPLVAPGTPLAGTLASWGLGALATQLTRQQAVVLAAAVVVFLGTVAGPLLTLSAAERAAPATALAATEPSPSPEPAPAETSVEAAAAIKAAAAAIPPLAPSAPATTPATFGTTNGVKRVANGLVPAAAVPAKPAAVSSPTAAAPAAAAPSAAPPKTTAPPAPPAAPATAALEPARTPLNGAVTAVKSPSPSPAPSSPAPRSPAPVTAASAAIGITGSPAAPLAPSDVVRGSGIGGGRTATTTDASNGITDSPSFAHSTTSVSFISRGGGSSRGGSPPPRLPTPGEEVVAAAASSVALPGRPSGGAGRSRSPSPEPTVSPAFSPAPGARKAAAARRQRSVSVAAMPDGAERDLALLGVVLFLAARTAFEVGRDVVGTVGPVVTRLATPPPAV